MEFYRMISKKELDILNTTGKISPSGIAWPPYGPYSVVSMFDHNDPYTILNRYAEAIADQRELKIGEILYLLKIVDPPNDVIADTSATEWPESRVHLGSIPQRCVTVKGEIRFEIKGDLRTYLQFEPYET